MGLSLKPTGNSYVDAVLQSVERASSYIHDSNEWECCPPADEPSYAHRIEGHAQAAADEITRLTKELEASRQREAKAEARGIEIAASLVEVTTTGAASREVVDLIRALKSTHKSNTQGGEGNNG